MQKVLFNKYVFMGRFMVLVFLFLIMSFTCHSQNNDKLIVYFKFDRFDLEQEEQIKMDHFIKGKIIQHVIITGHCDSLGNHEYNDALSLKRALEIKKYLVSVKIDENNIECKALGKRSLLNKSSDESERAKNRRVELQFTFKKTDPNQKEVSITGIVLNSDNVPIKAEISINDKNGKEIQSVKNQTDGKYELNTVVNLNEEYLLIYYNDSSFISSQNVSFNAKDAPVKNIQAVLPQLKGGKKYVLENLNFYGDTSQLISKSLPALIALEKLMRKNKNLVIKIEGHVNYPTSFADPKTTYPQSKRYVPKGMNCDQFNFWLSDERAKVVYNYLIDHGIDSTRMSMTGLGATKMIYPNAINDEQMSENRRVEINVISF